MKLGYDLRYLRWTAKQLAGSQNSYLAPVFLLQALLRQGSPRVDESLARTGVDRAALARELEQVASKNPSVDEQYARWQEQQTLFATVAPAGAQAMGESSVHSVHILLAIATAPGSLAPLLSRHGIRPGGLQEAMAAIEESGDDLVWRDRLLREAWYLAMTGDPQREMQLPVKRHPSAGYPIDSYRVRTLSLEL